MTATSKDRIEVAGKLRQMADAHDALNANRVAHALGLQHKICGTVMTFDSADIRNLADLIDPTCHVVTSGERRGKPIGSACSVCHAPLYPSTAWAHGMRYCTQCGSRVVDDDK